MNSIETNNTCNLLHAIEHKLQLKKKKEKKKIKWRRIEN